MRLPSLRRRANADDKEVTMTRTATEVEPRTVKVPGAALYADV